MLGFERRGAARFSMLLSIPAIAGAGVLKGWEVYRIGDAQLTFDILLAAVLAFGFAIAAIAVLMAWLRRATFTPFAIYRVILGAGLLIWIYAF
jgi:undecaprenyl-diphosphatase